ncbi:hypothetical protein VB712_15330 [Spirulina sp. CCNP1310]|uniref:hypothetical protein n=1 Tax=Spirulina sp. CCNP1310 TaxID=3110249 RepID=UPI002B212A96|nr:hypothetical protein [Spirulina sp. CCNP1310]MEA5420604.1 hypothetical protein [Spirulina sp. CCNP1310]
MVVWVVGFNVAIALLNCYLFWKIIQWRRCLRCTHYTLTRTERQMRRILTTAPRVIHQGQQGAQQTRLAYARLQSQIQQLQQLLSLLILVRKLWYRY